MNHENYNYPPAINALDKVKALFNATDSIGIMAKQFAKRGDSYTIDSNLFKDKFIFTQDPELIIHFLRKNHKKYDKSIFQSEILAKYTGKGLLTNTGKDWLKQRRLIQPGFSHQKIESLQKTMLQEIKKPIEQLPENKSLDWYSFFNQLAFDVVAKSLFSSNISQSQIEKIGVVLTKSQHYFVKETRDPLQKFFLYQLGYIKSILKEIDEVRDIFRSLIHQRNKSTQTHHDLLSMMMDVKYEDTQLPMEEEQLIDELFILFIAGHETTANSLSFTFYLLGKHPEYQTKIKEECKTLGEDKYAVETLFKPSITQNILNESMRLFPPAWVVDRAALEDDEYKNFSWKKGTIIVGNLFAMNRLESIWEKPNEFIPERFFEEKSKKKTFLPFGSGPRYCIGEHFARMEMSLVLRDFFSKYTFQLTEASVKIETVVTLRPNKVKGKKIAI